VRSRPAGEGAGVGGSRGVTARSRSRELRADVGVAFEAMRVDLGGLESSAWREVVEDDLCEPSSASGMVGSRWLGEVVAVLP